MEEFYDFTIYFLILFQKAIIIIPKDISFIKLSSISRYMIWIVSV